MAFLVRQMLKSACFPVDPGRAAISTKIPRSIVSYNTAKFVTEKLASCGVNHMETGIAEASPH
ncbi:hypothetical protein [Mesorhizobium delmotii]|uniref:Uncharacterized protein n=1 Tax=Mesorhizobium delmotii TaxID=1631247 RepID=A0A2P9AUN6_9HYPH|nr:hypothetical protein [Mesorhizobium delmotii]SJM34847.1 hypothetical protein BQ8482_530017 [Mesorhizobium delmotii]